MPTQLFSARPDLDPRDLAPYALLAGPPTLHGRRTVAPVRGPVLCVPVSAW
jgi:hypothetical protein